MYTVDHLITGALLSFVVMTGCMVVAVWLDDYLHGGDDDDN